MVGRWRMLLGLIGLAVLTVAAMPAQAQQPPAPVYSDRAGFPPVASTSKPADLIARETAAADAAEAACTAGDSAGCAALGNAYLLGEGRPQVRPVAEILLRRACYAGNGTGCLELAALLADRRDGEARTERTPLYLRACTLGEGRACQIASTFFLNSEDPEARKQGEALSARACQLGFPEGCEFPIPSPETIERRAAAACESDKGDACRELAAIWLEAGRSPRDRARGLALLDKQCRDRDPLACAAAAEAWRTDETREGLAKTAEYRALGCNVGDAELCSALGKEAIAGTPRDPAAARGFFELACESPGRQSDCANAADLREEPGLTESCSSGDQSACITLGLMLYRWDGVLLDRDRAIAVLSGACEAGATKACAPAAEYTLFGGSDPDQNARGMAALALLTRGCEAGEAEACEQLADELASGYPLPKDAERAAALYVPQCDAGRQRACDGLVKLGHPAAPPPLATEFDPPGRSAEEIAAEERAADEARDRAIAAIRASMCSSSTADFEGRTYQDVLCGNAEASIGGFFVRRSDQAPWQALLWRPAKLGRRDVGEEYRAACGGAVIATGWILTAAHCLVDHVDGVGKFPIEKSGYRIRLGVLRPLLNEGNSYPILRVIPHPLFVRKTLEFDIALVQYDTRAGLRGEGRPGVARIRLDDRSLAERRVVARDPVFSFGWGRTALNIPQAAEELQGVRLELRDAKECTKVTGFLDKRRDSVLCAAGPNGEQACFGDSGGPLITYRDAIGVPVLIGVVSGGVKCGTTGVPSRYTRVGHPLVQAWLASHVPGFRSGQTAR